MLHKDLTSCFAFATQLQPVHTAVLNPKAVKMGELYGEYNIMTNEWHDGLASSLIRAAVAETSSSRHWVVFDGPVDAIWIENMNTGECFRSSSVLQQIQWHSLCNANFTCQSPKNAVLDDNCTLCLPNGERIKLDAATMRMLFEVSDLAVASPATVSRCGMVYVPPEDMGWRPFIRSVAATTSQVKASIPSVLFLFFCAGLGSCSWQSSI
jgi:dynein heavy chain